MKRQLLAALLSITVLLAALPMSVLAAVESNQRPTNPGTTLTIGILNDSRADGSGEFPNEPSVTGYDYYYLKNDLGLTTNYFSSSSKFSQNAGSYINIDAFWNDERIQRNASGNAFGYYSATGLDLENDPFFVDGIQNVIDQERIISSWLSSERIQNADPSDYQLLFYVLKYETGYGEGYHLDAKVIKKNNVILNYDANKPEGVTADVVLPSSIVDAPPASATVEDMTRTSKTVTAGNMIFTFAGWNTKADGSGTAYDAGDVIQFSTNTTLYAQWKNSSTFTVTWRNYNGAVLETDTDVTYGTKVNTASVAEGEVCYNGSAPTRPSDSHKNYTFTGWLLTEGVYNASTGVAQNLTYTAQFSEEIITHKATVEVILNGTFDADGNRDLNVPGNNMDIEDLVSGSDGSVYLKLLNGSGEYIALTRSSEGVYSNAAVANGDYNIYLKVGTEYVKVDSQVLTMANADRTRYLPYYSVTYEDGVNGEVITVPSVAYYYLGSAVNVDTFVPQRTGYHFVNWKDESANTYIPSSALKITHITEYINQPYVLSATWSEAARVNVTVVVDHNGRTSDVAENLSVHLTALNASTGNYNEVASTLKKYAPSAWYTASNTSGDTTTFVLESLYTMLDSGALYGADASIDGYKYDTERSGGHIVIEKNQNEYDVTVYLVYDPAGYELEFEVKIEAGTPDRFVPTSVDVKVTRWDSTAGEWKPITQHEHMSVEVEIDKSTLSGKGKAHVWGFAGDGATPYLYRIEVVRIDLGTYQLTASEYTDNVLYSTVATGFFPAGAYTAEVEIIGSDLSGGTFPGAHAVRDGAALDYHGKITATVSAQAYNVILDPNGGQWSEGDTAAKTVVNRFTVPELSAYAPAKAGYSFVGWYVMDDAGALTGNRFDGGEHIVDHTDDLGDALKLYAMYKSNITVEGTVVIDLGFPCTDTNRELTVALQTLGDNGEYAATGFTTTVKLIPVSGKSYAVAAYKFENVPGTTMHRVNVIVPLGGEVLYMNEPDSIATNVDIYDVNAYGANRYEAVVGADNTAVVNIYAKAKLFELGFVADTSAIGKDFRPTDLILDLRHDHRDANAQPTYEVIKDDLQIADSDFTNGISKIYKIQVPPYHANGYLYDYVVSVLNYDIAQMNWDDRHYFHYDTTSGYYPAPFTIHYNGPANYSSVQNADGLYQSVTLVAQFEPNSYTITYDLQNGSWSSASEVGPDAHTWSFDTVIDATPVREGYMFMGWTASAEGVYDKDTNTIPAGVWQSVTLTANWERDTWNAAEDSDTEGDEIPDKYQVRFVYGCEDAEAGNVSPALQIVTIDGMSASGSVVASGSVATATGSHQFRKWITECDADFDDESENTGEITLDNAVGGQTYAFIATFDAMYTVSYDLSGGVGASGVDYSSVEVAEGTQITIKPAPANDGYNFDGFFFEGDYYMPGDSFTVTHDTVFVAVWDLIPPVVHGNVTLTKVDSKDSDTKLANVQFELYREWSDALVGTYTTDKDGNITVIDLLEGDYYWVETRPAEGYILDSAKHEFTVWAGNTTSITITNERNTVPSVFSGDHYAYVIGRDNGMVAPEATITRAEVATIFFRLLDENTRNTYISRTNNFADVAADAWYNTAISTMANMGIVFGYPNGNFGPDDNITRAEFAAIAARFDEHGNTTGSTFSDIYEHWAQKEIDIAANNGWVLGFEDGTFKPDQEITRAEAMALVNRVLQRIPEDENDLLDGMIVWPDNLDKKKWYYLTIQEATNSHEYDRKESGYEYWTDLTANPDWVEIEQ